MEEERLQNEKRNLRQKIVQWSTEWKNGVWPDIQALRASFQRLSELQKSQIGGRSHHRAYGEKVFDILEGCIREATEKVDKADATLLIKAYTTLCDIRQKLLVNQPDDDGKFGEMYDDALFEMMNQLLTLQGKQTVKSPLLHPAKEGMSSEAEDVDRLFKEQRKLVSQISIWNIFASTQDDFTLDIEKLNNAFQRFSEMQTMSIQNAIEKGQESEPLIEELQKCAQQVKQIKDRLKVPVASMANKSELQYEKGDVKTGNAVKPEPEESEFGEGKKGFNLLLEKQKMLHSQIALWHTDVSIEDDFDDLTIEKLNATRRELREVQGELIKRAIANKQDTMSLIEEDRKYVKMVKQIKDHLKGSNTEVTVQPEQEEDKFETPMDIPEDEELHKDSKRELNILLLGETGSGKSTTINALANYLFYNSFDTAATEEFKQVIPAKFTLPDQETGEPFVIKLGENESEFQAKQGNSVTHETRGYVFDFGNLTIRIIDTPGIADTRGAHIDKENFEKILVHLTQYEELHGICIFIKATETRKGIAFRFCINELLTYLHKDAVKNMAFLFTFSRNSFYGPGEGFATLRSFLSEELKEANIELISKGDKANCFFIDNEAFRYLVAKKNGHKFTSNQEQSYRESWHTSVDQTMRMFNRFLAEQPHSLNSTLSLNHARKVILQLAEPLARLQSKNSSNIQIIKEKEKSLDDRNKSKEELAQSLKLEIDDLVAKELEKPYTVCTAASCTSVLFVNGETKVNYKQKCHEPCDLTSIEAKKIGDPGLQKCWAINRESGKCIICKCHWQFHMHTEYDFYCVKRTIVDVNKEREIKTTDDAIQAINDFVKKTKKAIVEFEEEMDVIHDVSAFFACILRTYSNTPYNRFLEPHLNLLIEEEEKKINASDGKYSDEAKKKLVEMRDKHRQTVMMMETAIKNNTRNNVELKEIDSQIKRLKKLKHTGKNLMQIMEAIEKARVNGIAKTGRHSTFDLKNSFYSAISHPFAWGKKKVNETFGKKGS